MRTTVTLEDDLFILLEKRREARGESFKQALNDALRAGLTGDSVDVSTRAEGLVQVHAYDLGHSRLPDMNDIAEVLAFAEGEDHR